MDFKKEAARKAVELVKDNMVIGLGAGAAMAHLVCFLKEKVDAGSNLKVLTSSFTTRLLLQQNKFVIQDTSSTCELDIYFDGCDQFDKDLNALKSGGGIHTNEKILATMAKEFILVGDDSKYVETLQTKFPLVIEAMPQVLNFVPKAIMALYPDVKTELRMSNKKDGAVISENGNYIFDLWFTHWPELSSINPALKNIPGIIETSLFHNLAKRAVISGESGTKILPKST